MSAVIACRFRRRIRRERVFRDRRNPFDCFDDSQFFSGTCRLFCLF